MSVEAAVRATGVSKHYGATEALRDLNLEVPAGAFFGLLGPNGSGKSTAIHLLTTLIAPTSGSARVAGHDVVRDGLAVRREIGLVFQEPALDAALTVQETLEFAGRLRSLSRATIAQRSEELLALFQMQDKRGQRVGTLSGGTRRALDICRSLLHRPRILFLDEPTIGLDVPNRRRIWTHIHKLRRDEGTTVFLTTHYLEEAEDCDDVAFLANGRLIGGGRPSELIERLGRRMLEIEGENLGSVVSMLEPKLGPCLREEGRVLFRIQGNHFDLKNALGASVETLQSVRQRRPNLNDVFLWVNHPELAEAVAA